MASLHQKRNTFFAFEEEVADPMAASRDSSQPITSKTADATKRSGSKGSMGSSVATASGATTVGTGGL